MSADTILLTGANWHTSTDTVGTVIKQISKPSALKRVATVMITADKSNTGCIVFGSSDGLTISSNAGGQLEAKDVAVLPINLTSSNQELYIISDTAGQTYHISYFDGGDIC
jgi:hypothetical protein